MKNEKCPEGVPLGKYFIQTYGCQYNEWDSARLDFVLKKLGLEQAAEENAEIIFVLACSVRQTAIDRLIGKIKNWQNAGKKVYLSGCILDADRKKFEKKHIVLFDINKLEQLPQIMMSFRANENESRNLLEDPSTSVGMTTIMDGSRVSSAYLPIMIGCNNFCAYCAVPYTRGREKSRGFDEVVSDFKKLVQKGYKEIMLLGQNVNSYQFGFAKLLKALNNVPGDFIIRFTSNHPKDMSDEIIEAVRDLPKVKKEIHLPLQSGSNKILKAMNRPYTKEKYLDLALKIKKMIPEIELTTDVIVGFPGETEGDFQETVEVYKKVGYYQSFTNKYSPRSGTAAYKLGDPISWKEKQRRWKILNDIANKK